MSHDRNISIINVLPTWNCNRRIECHRVLRLECAQVFNIVMHPNAVNERCVLLYGSVVP